MSDPDYLEYLNSLNLSELLALEDDHPEDVDLLIRIGRTYLRAGELRRCNKYYSRALKIDPYNGWSHLFFGSLGMGLKCYEEAITHFSYAADFIPDSACPHWCLGDAYRAQGDFTRADLHYRKAVEIEPDNPTAHEKLEDWLDENGMTE